MATLIIVQLSDIHIATGKEAVLHRVKEIQAAVRTHVAEESGLLLVVNGDVAYGGIRGQYEVAKIFLTEIADALKTIPRAELIGKVIVPGNHDCDFNLAGDARPNLAVAVASNLEGYDIAGESIQQLLKVQSEFFDFEGSISGKQLQSKEQLSWGTSFTYDDKRIGVQAFNTALFSRVREQAGQLHFPINAINPSPQSSDIAITVFHHPYPWLEANNGKEFKKRIESTSDLVLTGHEHDGDSHVGLDRHGEETGYVEGAALHASGDTGFNIVTIDFPNTTYQVYRYQWADGMYSPQPAKARVFTRKQTLLNNRFENNPEFARRVALLGTGFVHPDAPGKNLTLADLFVYPDLKVASLTVKSPPSIQSSNVFSHIFEKTYLHIAGTATSGKSTLARQLYVDFQRRGIVPLLLNATSIKESSPSHLQKLLETAFVEQYQLNSWERFRQLDADRKVLLIDDWHRCRMHGKAKKRLLDASRHLFGRVIIFTDDVSLLQMLSETADEDEGVSDAEYCEIKQFGYKLRSEVIRKWCSIASDLTVDELELTSKISANEHVLDTLVRKGIVPSWPIFILSVLQANALSIEDTTAYGSYGHLYEALLTKRLSAASRRPSSLGLKYTYLSAIAYELFMTGKSALTESDMRRLHAKYEADYQLTENATDLWKELVEAGVLARSGDEFWFQYMYAFYFFVAKYYQQEISNLKEANTLRAQLSEMVRCVHDEDCSNILIFYLYLTKDRGLIEEMLDVASRIYSERQPADLDTDVAFVNKLRYRSPDILLKRTNIEANRVEYRAHLDDSEAIEQKTEQLVPKTEYRDDVNDVVKIQFAFKSLHVMGQVVKNFPLDLKGDLKVKLTHASYLLTLRTLRVFLNSIEANVADFLDMLESVLRRFEPMAKKSPEELRDVAGASMVRLTEMAIFGMIKKLSLAVGVVDLKKTYEQVKAEFGDENIPVRLLDLSIKLDHFNSIPEGEVTELEEKLKENVTAYTILRLLVAEFLYLFPCDYRTEQRMVKLFSFKPHVLNLGEKRVKRITN